MKFRTLPIVAILFIAAAMVVQFAISSSLEKEHVREVVEYKMQPAPNRPTTSPSCPSRGNDPSVPARVLSILSIVFGDVKGRSDNRG